MNREIRFRGWHVQKRVMFSAEEMANDQLTLLPTGRFINVSGTSTRLSEIYPQDEFIPLQYTGLKDRSGKEIYEGDIVVAPYHWDKPHAVSLPGDYYDFSEFAFLDGDLEVIGNIYENPGLVDDNRE